MKDSGVLQYKKMRLQIELTIVGCGNKHVRRQHELIGNSNLPLEINFIKKSF